LCPPGGQGCPLPLGRTCLVAQIIGNAKKRIKGTHAAALSFGKQAKGMVKVPGLAAGQVLAIGTRCGQFGPWDGDSHSALLPDGQRGTYPAPKGPSYQCSLFPPRQYGPALPNVVAEAFDLPQDGEASLDEQLDIGSVQRPDQIHERI